MFDQKTISYLASWYIFQNRVVCHWCVVMSVVGMVVVRSVPIVLLYFHLMFLWVTMIVSRSPSFLPTATFITLALRTAYLLYPYLSISLPGNDWAVSPRTHWSSSNAYLLTSHPLSYLLPLLKVLGKWSSFVVASIITSLRIHGFARKRQNEITCRPLSHERPSTMQGTWMNDKTQPRTVKVSWRKWLQFRK